MGWPLTAAHKNFDQTGLSEPLEKPGQNFTTKEWRKPITLSRIPDATDDSFALKCLGEKDRKTTQNKQKSQCDDKTGQPSAHHDKAV